MGDLSNFHEFMKYNFKKGVGLLKKDPERLLIGAIDPASSWAWGKITGKDYTPVINQLGSPMGGGDLGLKKDGGVYAEAQAEGVPTKEAARFHTIGDTVAGFFGGSAAGGALGGGSSAATGTAGGTSGGVVGGTAEALPMVTVTAPTSFGLSGLAGIGAGTGAAGASATTLPEVTVTAPAGGGAAGAAGAAGTAAASNPDSWEDYYKKYSKFGASNGSSAEDEEEERKRLELINNQDFAVNEALAAQYRAMKQQTPAYQVALANSLRRYG